MAPLVTPSSAPARSASHTIVGQLVDAVVSDAVPLSTMSGAVERTPCYVRSRGEPLFAWLHAPADRLALNHGVVICPPLGYEQLHVHRSLRLLADNLAGSQIPVLRFDWHGTGDSAGVDEDPERCAHWLQNVRDAMAWLRDEVGCQRVSLIGVRLGALLAAQALTGTDAGVDRLVLWAPVMKGRSYVREMRAIDRTSEAPRNPAAQASPDIEAAGFVLTAETAAELANLELCQTRPRCQRALIVHRDDAPAPVTEWLASRQITADQVTVSGFVEMLAEPHHSRVPVEAIRHIAAWLRQHILATDAAGSIVCTTAFQPQRAGVPGHVEARIGDLREQPWRISENPDLFGIITEPATPQEDRPTVVLLNSGAAYRAGPGRLSVLLARHLAANGFRTLRLDLCGLGDSVAAPGEPDHNGYSSRAFRDIDLALTRLREQYGPAPCTLVGLCSGAYNAFQAAAQLNQPNLVESVLINPLTFYWNDSMSLDAAPVRQLITQQYYLRSAREWRKWWNLLSGRSRIGLFGAARLVAQRLLWRPRPAATGANAGNESPGIPGHPRVQDLPADLARVVAANRRLAMFFSTTDPGHGILMQQASRAVKRLQKSDDLQLRFIEQADHTFSRRTARTELLQSLSEHLAGRP